MADTGAGPLTDGASAAAQAVAEAEAAAAEGVATAEAAAALGDAQAAEAYELTMAILQGGQVELIPALLALVATSIEEGIAAYLAEQAAAKVAFEEAEATYQAYAKEISSELAEYENLIAGKMNKRPG